jgi:hypothetical protein
LLDYDDAAARLRSFADTIGVEPPARLLSPDGAPAPELLRFCLSSGVSLDWIFCGEGSAMRRTTGAGS